MTGKVLVPVEANDVMMDAGAKAGGGAPLNSEGLPGYAVARAVWDAMVAAVPKQPKVHATRSNIMEVCAALARIAQGGLQEEADAYTLGQAAGYLLALAPRGEP